MKELGIGIIGVGLWGENHVKIYKDNPHCRIIGVSDINEKRAEEIAKKYNIKIWSKNYSTLLDNKEIDIVSITVPDFAHYEPVCQAAEAKKHILVEKPLATDLEEAKKMVQICQKNKVKMMVNFSNRWNPSFVHVKNAINTGELGQVLHSFIKLNDTIFVPTTMLKWSRKTNVVFFIGSHAIDLLCWLMSSNVESVYSVSMSVVLKERAINTPDYFQTLIKFKTGTSALLENSWILPLTSANIYDFKAEFVGTNGTMYIDSSHNRCVEKYIENESAYPDVLGLYSNSEGIRGFVADSINHFIRCVLEDREPDVKLEDGVTNVAIIRAIIESAESGKVVTLDQ